MMYTMHAVITRALRLEYDDRDDPIVEIPAPADYKPREPRPPDRLRHGPRRGARGLTCAPPVLPIATPRAGA